MGAPQRPGRVPANRIPEHSSVELIVHQHPGVHDGCVDASNVKLAEAHALAVELLKDVCDAELGRIREEQVAT